MTDLIPWIVPVTEADHDLLRPAWRKFIPAKPASQSDPID